MKITAKVKAVLLVCASILIYTGCLQEEGDKLPYYTFMVSPENGITFAYEVFNDSIQITTNTTWSVNNTAEDWLELTVNKGLIKINAKPNETAESKTADLIFSVNGMSQVKYSVTALPMIRDKKEISILTYNVKDGFAGLNGTTPNNSGTLARFRAFMKTQSPDIICYQELKGYNTESFKNFAATLDIGHEYTELFTVSSGYNLGISSKYPITGLGTYQDGMTNGILMVTCCNIGLGITQLDGSSEDKRLTESNLIIDLMRTYTLKGKTLDGTVIAGDMNALSSYDQSIYGNAHEYEAINSFKTAGYPGIYELLGTPVGENTTNMSGDNYRYDHILVSSGLQNSCVSYGAITDSPVPNISDHFPVKTVIKVTK